MHPRFLQSTIHSEKSSTLAVWEGYQTNVVDAYTVAPLLEDLHDHLIREFNRRVYNLGFYSLLFSPYDGGFRLAGVYVTGSGGGGSGSGSGGGGSGSGVAPANALVYNNDNLVYNFDYFIYGA
jgi:hypothetical protein